MWLECVLTALWLESNVNKCVKSFVLLFVKGNLLVSDYVCKIEFWVSYDLMSCSCVWYLFLTQFITFDKYFCFVVMLKVMPWGCCYCDTSWDWRGDLYGTSRLSDYIFMFLIIIKMAPKNNQLSSRCFIVGLTSKGLH